MCPWLYFLEYVCNIPSESGRAARIGTIIHGVLEESSIARLKGLPDIDRFKLLAELVVKDGDLRPDDVKKGTRCLEWFQKNSEWDPYSKSIIGVETKFEIELEGEKWRTVDESGKECQLVITGTVDRTDEIGPDWLHIIDYKTGARKDFSKPKPTVKTSQDIFMDIQPRMYHKALKHIYGERYSNFLVTMLYPNDGGPFTISYNDEDIKVTDNMLQKRFRTILTNNNPKRNQSWKCKSFCSHGKNGICDKVFSDFNKYGIEYATMMWAKPASYRRG